MPARFRSVYKRAAVIVHGKSELCLVTFIYTNLHAPVTVIAKNKGRESIQINSLKALLSSPPYKSLKSFSKEYAVEYDAKKKQLNNFKLFIIMDTDDCSEYAREDYISGKLFKDCALKEYIVPIYNTPNLENVMMKAGIMKTQISDSEKGKYYSKYFPINENPMNEDTKQQILDFRKSIASLKETNMTEFIDYCLDLI